MPDAPRIRPFRPGDETVFQCLNEAWITKYFSIEPKDRALFDDPQGQILDRGGAILLVECGGEPVGCCALLPRDAETFELAKMAVAETHQGRGLGRLLLEACIELARAAGKRRLYLETNSRLGAAMALYRQLGFVELPPNQWPASEYARVDRVMELRL